MAIKIDGETVYLPNGRPAPRRKKPKKIPIVDSWQQIATKPQIAAANKVLNPPTPGAITDISRLSKLGTSLNWGEIRWLQKLAWTPVEKDTPAEIRAAISVAKGFIDEAKKDPNFRVGLDAKAWKEQGITRNTDWYDQALGAQTSAKQRAALGTSRAKYVEELPEFLPAAPRPFTNEEVAQSARNLYGKPGDKNLGGLLAAKNIAGMRTVPGKNGESDTLEVLFEKDGSTSVVKVPFDGLPDKIAPLAPTADPTSGTLPSGVYTPLGGRMDSQLSMFQKAWNKVFNDTGVPQLPFEIAGALIANDAPELETQKQAETMFRALKDPLLTDPRNPYRVDPLTFFRFENDLQDELAKGAQGSPESFIEGDPQHEVETANGMPIGQFSKEHQIRLDGLLAQVPLSIGLMGIREDYDKLVSRRNETSQIARRRMKMRGDSDEPPLNAITMLQSWLTEVDPSIKVGGEWTQEMDDAIQRKALAGALWRVYADPNDAEADIYLKSVGFQDAHELLTNTLAAPLIPTDAEQAAMTPEQLDEVLRQRQMSVEERKAELLTGLAFDSRLPFESGASAVYRLYQVDKKQVTPQYAAIFENARVIAEENYGPGVIPPKSKVKTKGTVGTTPRYETLLNTAQVDQLVYTSISMAELELDKPAAQKSEWDKFWNGLNPLAQAKEKGSVLLQYAPFVFNAGSQVVTTVMESAGLEAGQQLANIDPLNRKPGDLSVGGPGGGAARLSKEHVTELIADWNQYLFSQAVLSPDKSVEELASPWRQAGYAWDEMRRRSGGTFMSMGVYTLQDVNPEYKPGDNMLAEFFIDAAFELMLYAPLAGGYELGKVALTRSTAWKASRDMLGSKLGMKTVAQLWADTPNASVFFDVFGIRNPTVCVRLGKTTTTKEVKEVWEQFLLHQEIPTDEVFDAVHIPEFNPGHLDMAQVDPSQWAFGPQLRMRVTVQHPLLTKIFHVSNTTTNSGEHALNSNSVRSLGDAAMTVFDDPMDVVRAKDEVVHILAGESNGTPMLDLLEMKLLPDRAAARLGGDVKAFGVEGARQRLAKLEIKVAEMEREYAQIAASKVRPGLQRKAAKELAREKEILAQLTFRVASSGERMAGERGRRTLPKTVGTTNPYRLRDQGERLVGERILTPSELMDVKHNLKQYIDDMYDLFDDIRYSRPADDDYRLGIFHTKDKVGYDDEILRTKDLFGGEGFISDGRLFDYWSDYMVRGVDSKWHRGLTASSRARAEREPLIGQKYGHDVLGEETGDTAKVVAPGEVYNKLLKPEVAKRRQIKALLELQKEAKKVQNRIRVAQSSILKGIKKVDNQMSHLVRDYEKVGLSTEQAVLEADRAMLNAVAEAGGFTIDEATDKIALAMLANDAGVPMQTIQRWFTDWAKVSADVRVPEAVPNHPMYYKMGATENVTGQATTTIDLMEQGRRTSTTRGWGDNPPVGTTGDVVTFEGRPQQYIITGTHKITPEDMADPEFIKRLARTEGWTEEAIRGRHKNQIKVGAWVTSFRKYSTEAGRELEGFVLHSGGAEGADSFWGKVGQRYGVLQRHYHAAVGKKPPMGNVALTAEQLVEAVPHVRSAARILGKNVPNPGYVGNLIARNWFQVRDSDAIFGVLKTHPDTGMKGSGTGWALAMGIDEGKPVHALDQSSGKWYRWSEEATPAEFAHDENHWEPPQPGWVEEPRPTLTPNFGGIGSRNLTDIGKREIEAVYDQTVSNLLVANRASPNIASRATFLDKVRENARLMKAERAKAYKAQMMVRLAGAPPRDLAIMRHLINATISGDDSQLREALRIAKAFDPGMPIFSDATQLGKHFQGVSQLIADEVIDPFAERLPTPALIPAQASFKELTDRGIRATLSTGAPAKNADELIDELEDIMHKFIEFNSSVDPKDYGNAYNAFRTAYRGVDDFHDLDKLTPSQRADLKLADFALIHEIARSRVTNALHDIRASLALVNEVELEQMLGKNPNIENVTFRFDFKPTVNLNTLDVKDGPYAATESHFATQGGSPIKHVIEYNLANPVWDGVGMDMRALYGRQWAHSPLYQTEGGITVHEVGHMRSARTGQQWDKRDIIDPYEEAAAERAFGEYAALNTEELFAEAYGKLVTTGTFTADELNVLDGVLPNQTANLADVRARGLIDPETTRGTPDEFAPEENVTMPGEPGLPRFGPQSAWSSFTRALTGDMDELEQYFDALMGLDAIRTQQSRKQVQALKVIRECEEALKQFDDAGSMEAALSIYRKQLEEVRVSQKPNDARSAIENAYDNVIAKSPEQRQAKHTLSPDEKRGEVFEAIADTQPLLPYQMSEWAHAPWDTHQMMTWRLGPVARKIEEINTKKRWIFANHTLDQASNAFKTIILARVATAIRIVLGDEATRFIPEGIDPIAARHLFTELKALELKTGRQIIPAELQGSLSSLFGAIRKSNYTILSPEEVDFFPNYLGALKQWNTDPLVRMWRDTYMKAIRPLNHPLGGLGLSEDQAVESCRQMLLKEAKDTGPDNVVNRHLRLSNRLWMNNASLKSTFGDATTTTKTLEAMRIDFETQNVDEWVDQVNGTLTFYAQNRYTGQHFLPDVNTNEYLKPEVKHFKDVQSAPRKLTRNELTNEPLNARELMPTIIARVTGPEPGSPYLPQRWFGAMLESFSSYITEGTYAHFYVKARTQYLAELGRRAGLTAAKHGFDPEDIWKASQLLPQNAVEEIERRAMAYGQQQVQRVMYTSGTSAAEDLLRNMILFLPAQRQYLAYWGHAIIAHPWLLAYFNRLDKLPSYLEIPGPAPGDWQGENTKYKLYLRGLLFATPGFREDTPGQKVYSMIPGLGLPGIIVGLGANIAESGGWDAPKDIAMKLPGGDFYKDMWRPLNSSLTQFGYAISTLATGRPNNLLPEQIVGSDAQRLENYVNLLKMTIARAMGGGDGVRFGDIPEPKSHARFVEGLRALTEAGWNFFVPMKMRILDTDATQYLDAQRAWDATTTYGERLKLLDANKNTMWGKVMRVELESNALKAKAYQLSHPEVIPYIVQPIKVMRPAGEEYDFEDLAYQSKQSIISLGQRNVAVGISKKIDAEQKWFDEVYLPAVKNQEKWVGPGIVGLPGEMAGEWTPSSFYNLDRIEEDFRTGKGVFEQGIKQGGTMHYGLGGYANELDTLGGKTYLPVNDFASQPDSRVYKATEALFELRSGARFVRTARNYKEFADIYRVSHKEGEIETVITAATKPFTRMSELEMAAVYGKKMGIEERWILQHIAGQITWYDKMKSDWEGKNKGDYRDSDIGEAVWARLTKEIWTYCAGPNAPETLRGGIAKQMLYTPLARPHYVIYENPTEDLLTPSMRQPNHPLDDRERFLDDAVGIYDYRPEDNSGDKPRIPSSLPKSDKSGMRKIKFGERALPERLIPSIVMGGALGMEMGHKNGQPSLILSKAEVAIAEAEGVYQKAFLKTADPITKYNYKETQRAYCWDIFLRYMVERHVDLWSTHSEYQSYSGNYYGRTPTEKISVKAVNRIEKGWLPPLFKISPLFEQEWKYYNRKADGNLVWDMLNTFR